MYGSVLVMLCWLVCCCVTIYNTRGYVRGVECGFFTARCVYDGFTIIVVVFAVHVVVLLCVCANGVGYCGVGACDDGDDRVVWCMHGIACVTVLSCMTLLQWV